MTRTAPGDATPDPVDAPAAPAPTGPAAAATVSTASASADPLYAAPRTERAWRRRLTAEIWIVLGLSLGRSGVYAVVAILDRLTRDQALADQTATLNPSRSPRPWLDLTYQLLSIGFALVPVALALYLLSAHGRSAVRRIGLDGTRPWRDLGVGAGLAALIGIPGLGLYAVGRALGLTVEVQAAALDAAWWTVPVLVLAALQNALLEEVVAVGYLMERLRDLRWSPALVVVASALLRGSYHLYQGWGAFVGNVVMGLVFAEYYRRRRRVMPLVVAHTLMDVVVFVGYALVPDEWRDALHLS
ncbi:CPBP family intramembrane glutamic endopeptidase [Cellulomonas fimi]|uniref:Abortive infection protein n=1 Tax=Cellulomonas fimi (strain ATCC 484 / DSM 20113 / JCM 1341 / CCUG 24087 / LMG 16345 / NBRC 15513 / NCIMB 8980 / NCTC 7547 / NRS-133) TaxID=590998 RepID=F4H5P4_CELFA|nr:CPBP family intramembrane glutamic endopeptidase [Cellulomonas fimi]AEE44368.1 Abortive infection protein [Cellulomonas fimi ATCC 484]NNH08652.1 CPBP family intramembrane metalloprotease [Cellulomonas fimi]VEH26218.1 CAAX amino terminal protease self- immunity [Cellulomonas fimi]